jgi:hypothetical protein
MELEHKAHWAIKRWNMDFEATGEKRMMQISELEEWREKAYHSSKLYKKEPRDGMIRESRRSLHPETRYYFLIPGSNYLGMKNDGANGKDHLRW